MTGRSMKNGTQWMIGKMDRIIFHCDCNNFFASCEILQRPELRNVPMAVAGDPERRTGIVVAKNEIAKKAGVKTTDTVFAAKRKCPDIVFVPPRHRYYAQISDSVNAIYRRYTEYVEPASIDESYLDLTGAAGFYGKTPVGLADEIRARVREEIGITISVGVSYNKVFAKMGSDYKKPDATTEITRENYRDILWPLPVSDMLFAGRSTVETLKRKYIHTIGDLAMCPRELLHDMLGKGGDMLWMYANGLDDSPVKRFDAHDEVKSISKGMTFRHDLTMEAEVRSGVSALSDDVATQLRKQELEASVVTVQIKTPQMITTGRQQKLKRPTCLQSEIYNVAMQLVRNNWSIGTQAPIRAITVGVSGLIHADQVDEQISIFDSGEEKAKSDRQIRLEATIDRLRRKHGNKAITLGIQNNDDIGL